MKAQVTFIAIIAVLAIVGVAGAFFIFSDRAPAPSGDQTKNLTSLESCAQHAFDESISLVGLYGGWPKLHPDFIQKGSYFKMGDRNFPIWSDPTQIPTRTQLESQIEDDMTNRLASCFSQLEGPKDVTISVQLRDTTSRAAIEVNAWLPSATGQQRIAPFAVESSLPILRARDTAEAFAKEAWSKDVLTNLNFNLISLNPNVPLEGVDFSCAPKRWTVSDVSKAFFSSVQDATAYVSFDGTPRVSNDKIASKLTFDMKSVPSDIDVSAYYYTDFGGDLKVERSSGDKMTSQVATSPDGALCQNTYQFWYSMDYPIVFTLTVPSKTDSYLFRFALPIAVARNRVPSDQVQTSAPSTFCSEVTPRTFSLRVLDSSTGDPLDDVSATYTCGDQSCPLASVSGGIEDHLPSRCLSGTIALAKEGYAPKTIDYRYDQSLSGTDVELDPLKHVTLKYQCSSEPCSFNGYIIARVDGTAYPLTVGDNYLPHGDTQVLVLEDRGGGPEVTYKFGLTSGNNIILAVDTDAYADPSGLSLTQVFPSGAEALS